MDERDEGTEDEAPERGPTCGCLSLVALLVAFACGLILYSSLTSGGGFEAFGGGVAAIAIGLMASIPSFILAGLSVARRESPRWPGVLGLILSLLPAGIGAWILIQLLWEYLART